MHAFFTALGHFLVRRRRMVLALWVVLALFGALGAARLPAALLEGSSSVKGSSSERVDELLQTEFDNPFKRNLLVCFDSSRFKVGDPAYQSWFREAVDTVRPLAGVGKTLSWLDTHDSRLVSRDGHQAILMVGIEASDVFAEQAAVPRLRQALKGLRERMAQADPSAQLAVTGRVSIVYDIDQHSKDDANRAELRALPLTLLILLYAFGALVAAGVPLVAAGVGVSLASALAWLGTHFLPLSNLLQNILSMVGLAIGIDYSLLIVSRFREERVNRSREEALVTVVAHTGPAIVYSGLTVMIGMVALLFTPMIELQSIGVGGMLVVVISVLSAVTLVPGLLWYLDGHLDWPGWFSRPLLDGRGRRAWKRWAEWVMDRPRRTLLASTLLVGVIAWPTLKMVPGFSNAHWLPRTMESRTGVVILDKLGNSNAITPIYLMVSATDGRPAIDTRHVPGLYRYTQALQAEPGVGEVLSPFTVRKGLTLLDYLLLYRSPEAAFRRYPQLRELFVSKDRTRLLFQVVPRGDLPVRECQALAERLGKLAPEGPYTVLVGGEPQYWNDFNRAMARSYVPVFSFVLGITFTVLLVAFRSILLPLKAILMNLLAVGAGYGAVVAVFQWGWLGGLIGLEEPLGAIPWSIPMMIFCITFGLSMDYEVFLLARIKEVYDACHDNRQATSEGLASTGGIITSAAMTMVVVFGASAMAEIVIVKMIGVGLAVAVLIDATLIRILLVPSFMRIAGRWNWYPGDRRHGNVSSQPPPDSGSR